MDEINQLRVIDTDCKSAGAVRDAKLVGLLLGANVQGFELGLDVHISHDFNRHLAGDSLLFF